MKKSISKPEAEKKIGEFFYHINEKTPKEVKKIKRLAMSYKIKLGGKRKTFCKKCLSPYVDSKTRVKNKTKLIICSGCGSVSRWKVK